MYLVLRTPSVPEEGNGQQPGEPDGHVQSHLGLKDAIVLLGKTDDGFVTIHGDDEPPKRRPAPEAQIHETGQADGEAVCLLKDGGDGGKEKIERAVRKRDVNGEEENDGGKEEHLDGADQAVDQVFPQRLFLGSGGVVTASQIVALKLLLEADNLLLNEHPVTSLLVEDLDRNRYADSDHQHNPEVPTPADGFCYETTNQGTDSRT